MYVRDCTTAAVFSDEDGTQVSSGLDAHGRELPDSTPQAVPVHLQAGPSLAETVRRQILGQLSVAAHNHGFESLEEADDFEVEDDDLDPHTPYEAVFDPPVPGEPDAVKPNPGPAPAADGALSKPGAGGTPAAALSTLSKAQRDELRQALSQFDAVPEPAAPSAQSPT